MRKEADSEDHELARNARAGSMPAFEALVSRYEARIFSFIRQRCQNMDDAQELTQDTFVKTWSALDRWDPDRPFKSWLFAIARNTCIDHHRLSKIRAVSGRESDTDENTPSELLARREDAEGLWNIARRVLPQTQFDSLWLRYVEDMDVTAIAAVLGKSKTHVKVLLFRARSTLARHPQMPRRNASGENPARFNAVIADNQTTILL